MFSFLNLSPLSLSIMANLLKTNLDPGRKTQCGQRIDHVALTVPDIHLPGGFLSISVP